MKEKEIYEKLEKQNPKKTKSKKEVSSKSWIIRIVLLTFVLSIVMELVSETSLPKVAFFLKILITCVFIFIGVIFDIVGIAVTIADEKVFHSMSARKIKGATVAVKLKKNADKVSSFCCDAIGDICGVVSGSAGITLTNDVVKVFHLPHLMTSLIITGLIATLTIAGKALGKSYAIDKSNIILYKFSNILSLIYQPKN